MTPCPSSTAASCRRCSRSTRSRLVFSAVVLLASLSSTVSASLTAYPPYITAHASLDLAREPLRLETQAPAHGVHPVAVEAAVNYELLRRDASEDGDSSSRAPADEDDDRSTSNGGNRETTSRGDDSRTTSDDDRRRSTTSADDSDTSTTRTVPPPQTLSMILSSSSTADPTSVPLPLPFDDSLPADFKGPNSDNSCPDFISNLLADPTFQSCYPVSMMMQSSRSFFEAQKQLLDIVRVLDASCSADLDFCTNYLEEAARNLTSADNCGEEFEDPNTSATAPVMQAFSGLRSYNTMYRATCLVDPEEDMYCYASAVTNTTMPSDTYLYFMPYGLSLPGSSTPSCNQCVTETMGIFHAAAADRSQLIADTYEDAARQINTICGPNFVDAALPPPEASFGVRFTTPSFFTLLGISAGITLIMIF